MPAVTEGRGPVAGASEQPEDNRHGYERQDEHPERPLPAVEGGYGRRGVGRDRRPYVPHAVDAQYQTLHVRREPLVDEGNPDRERATSEPDEEHRDDQYEHEGGEDRPTPKAVREKAYGDAEQGAQYDRRRDDDAYLGARQLV